MKRLLIALAFVLMACALTSCDLFAPRGVVYNISDDGTYAEVIYYNGFGKEVVIEDTYEGVPVRTINDYAFKSSRITKVLIPDSVSSIGEKAFSNCKSLESVTIGINVTTIGSGAFAGCLKLTSITIPDNITSIGNNAFRDCNSALYTEHEYVKYVGDANNPYAVLINVTSKNLNTYT